MAEPRIIVHRISDKEPGMAGDITPVLQKIASTPPKKKHKAPRVSLDEIIERHKEAVASAEEDSAEILEYLKSAGAVGKTHAELVEEFGWPSKRVSSANLILTRRGIVRVVGYHLIYQGEESAREVTATRSKTTTTTTVHEEETVSLKETAQEIQIPQFLPPEPKAEVIAQPEVPALPAPAAPPNDERESLLTRLYQQRQQLDDQIAATELLLDLSSGSSRLIFLLNDYVDFLKDAITCVDLDDEKVLEGNKEDALKFVRILEGAGGLGNIFKRTGELLKAQAEINEGIYTDDDPDPDAVQCRKDTEDGYRLAEMFGVKVVRDKP